jgi:hypothetical protein
MRTSTIYPDFSLAFQQMASFLSIAKMKAFPDILDELFQQCLVLLPDERITNTSDLAHAIKVLFGIPIREKDIDLSIVRICDKLI